MAVLCCRAVLGLEAGQQSGCKLLLRGPAAPPGGGDESRLSTGDVHTGLVEANSRAYWRMSARGNLLGPDP